MLMSALGGVAIAQTMTSLPHGMGYFLTYEKGLPHGMANGVLTQAYLELFPAGDENVAKVLEYLGFASTDEMAPFWMPFWSIIPFTPKQMSQAIPTASWSRRVSLQPSLILWKEKISTICIEKAC